MANYSGYTNGGNGCKAARARRKSPRVFRQGLGVVISKPKAPTAPKVKKPKALKGR